MERKKLAWRAAGAGKWTGYEGVAAERRETARSRGIKNERRRHIFIAELYKCVYRG